jgi:hypothetical protein
MHCVIRSAKALSAEDDFPGMKEAQVSGWAKSCQGLPGEKPDVFTLTPVGFDPSVGR